MNFTTRLPTPFDLLDVPAQPRSWMAHACVRVARCCGVLLALILAEFLAALCYVYPCLLLSVDTTGFLLTLSLGVGLMSVAPQPISLAVKWLSEPHSGNKS